MKLILWAGGINGEGSSKVALEIIKSLLLDYQNLNYRIFISAKSSLEEKLYDLNSETMS